jgi:hypothetical protein
MKTLRFVNHRAFSVGSAGWFTVLRPNKWFATSRFRGSSQHLSGRSAGAAESAVPERKALNHANNRETTLLFQSTELNGQDHHPVRLVLIVLAAIAIMLVMLSWLCNYGVWSL